MLLKNILGAGELAVTGMAIDEQAAARCTSSKGNTREKKQATMGRL
jgi:hypothetical protein